MNNNPDVAMPEVEPIEDLKAAGIPTTLAELSQNVRAVRTELGYFNDNELGKKIGLDPNRPSPK